MDKDFVPDEATALKIAEAIIVAHDSKEFLEKYRPLNIQSEDDHWIVFGSNKDPNLKGGGGPDLKIAKKDGRIISYYYAR